MYCCCGVKEIQTRTYVFAPVIRANSWLSLVSHGGRPIFVMSLWERKIVWRTPGPVGNRPGMTIKEVVVHKFLGFKTHYLSWALQLFLVLPW